MYVPPIYVPPYVQPNPYQSYPWWFASPYNMTTGFASSVHALWSYTADGGGNTQGLLNM